MILRDLSEVEDPRCDRIVQFDPRSLSYSVIDAVPENHLSWEGLEVISKVRIKHKGNHLDQGREGACVGMGLTNAMRYEPIIGDLDKYNERFAIEQVYWEAQKNDQFQGGEYPGASPRMGGTSVLEGVKQLKRLGLISGYRWAFTIEELLLGLGYFGVAVIGVPWYERMNYPEEDGRIRIGGRVVGGHCVALIGYNKNSERVRVAQSWGMDYGILGECYLMRDDLDCLLNQQGECVFLEKVKYHA